MVDSIVRLSPSGPVVGKGNSPGFGARLRLVDTSSPMSGSQVIPTVPDAISPDGFGTQNPLVLTLDSPKENLHYRASLSLDVVNTSTNVGGEVVLYLDLSIDGGATYTTRAQNAHVINASLTGAEARQMQVWLPLIFGGSLGISDASPPPNIKLRARASQVEGTNALSVNSLATSDGAMPVTALNGTIHMELEECL